MLVPTVVWAMGHFPRQPATGAPAARTILCSDLVSSLFRSVTRPSLEGMVEAAEIHVT
jgi:hypothetical protein